VTPRVVFDCMVYIQALANARGPAYACYELVRSGRVTLCVSPAILAEVRDVLNRPKLKRKLPALKPEAIGAFLQDVEARAELLTEVPPAFTLARDPKDEPYLNLAIAAKAEYLVSRDNDLLDLMADPAFQAQHPSLSIVSPPALLGELNPATDEAAPNESGQEPTA
jgi:putative PIN family toxin of toxin-antitoxin system